MFPLKKLFSALRIENWLEASDFHGFLDAYAPEFVPDKVIDLISLGVSHGASFGASFLGAITPTLHSLLLFPLFLMTPVMVNEKLGIGGSILRSTKLVMRNFLPLFLSQKIFNAALMSSVGFIVDTVGLLPGARHLLTIAKPAIAPPLFVFYLTAAMHFRFKAHEVLSGTTEPNLDILSHVGTTLGIKQSRRINPRVRARQDVGTEPIGTAL